jgi:hypothetical protein
LATDSAVNVTRYDAEEGGVIEGTFSATITPVPSNGSKEITEGEFRVKRSRIHMLLFKNSAEIYI